MSETEQVRGEDKNKIGKKCNKMRQKAESAEVPTAEKGKTGVSYMDMTPVDWLAHSIILLFRDNVMRPGNSPRSRETNYFLNWEIVLIVVLLFCVLARLRFTSLLSIFCV
tara:strand:+ start:1364 stop:1693 length:330 start_codon:yes stop_codon:yes gene_type:complete